MNAHILAIRINKFMNTYCNRTVSGNDSVYIDNIERDLIAGNLHSLEQAIESGVRRHPGAAEEANSLLRDMRH